MTETDLTDIANVYEAYRAATVERARWEKVTKELSPLLKKAIGEAEYGTIDGVPALRKQTIVRHVFDEDGFRSDFPELSEKYMVDIEQTRLTIVRR